MNDKQLFEHLFVYVESLLQDAEQALTLHRQTVSANYLQKKIYECDGAMNFVKGLFNSDSTADGGEVAKAWDTPEHQAQIVQLLGHDPVPPAFNFGDALDMLFRG